MHVVKVRSNVKGRVDAQLGQRTLLVGDNGTGKDALLASVELALLGRVSDLAGKRDVGDGLALASLAPPGASELWAEVELSDGTTASFSLAIGNGKTSKKKHDAPEAIFLPLRELRAELSASDDRARAFLMAQMGGTVGTEALLAEIPASLHERFRELAGDAAPTLGLLRTVQQTAAQRARDAKKEADAAERALNEVVTAGAAVPSAEDIEALKQTAEAAQARLAAARQAVEEARSVAHRHGGLVAERQRIEGGLRALVGEVGQVRADFARAEEDVARMGQWEASEAPPADLAHVKAVSDYWTFVATAAERQLAVTPEAPCICCGSALTDPHAIAHANLTAARQALAGVEGALAAEAQRAKRQEQTAAMREKLETYRRQVEPWLVQAAQRMAEMQAALAAMPEAVGSLPDVAGLSQAVEEAAEAAMRAREAYARAQGAAGASTGRAKHLEAKARAQAEQAQYAQLAEACEAAGIALLSKRVAAFIDKARSFMPALPHGGELAIVLKDGARDICKVGLVYPDGALHVALSGAEWNIVTTAIAQALAADRKGVALIIPEERAYDPATLGRWMRALASSSAQVLLASPIEPSGRKPAGWTVCKTSDYRDPVAAAEVLPLSTPPEA